MGQKPGNAAAHAADDGGGDPWTVLCVDAPPSIAVVNVTVQDEPVTTVLYELPDPEAGLPHQHDASPPASAPGSMRQHWLVAGDVSVAEMQPPSADTRVSVIHDRMAPPE